jgi:dihydrofolate synthase/folylpolyglutamate synthase
LPEAEFCQELTEFLKLIKKSGLEPSYFEIMVAFAYWEFVRQGAEYAAVEVGLGGLVDGTNVVGRSDKVCVITDIGLDHINILGSTLGEIARHKAGIIQLHNNVFCYRQDQSVMGQISKQARQKSADVHILEGDAVLSDFQRLPLFQQRNLGLALQAVNQILRQDGEAEITDKQLAEAAKTYIPARMEEMKREGKIVIVDGAHNAQKLHALCQSVRNKYPHQKIAAVVSFVSQRSYRLAESAKELVKLLDHIILTSFDGPQDGPHASVGTDELLRVFARHSAKPVEVVADPTQALQKLLKRPEPIVMVAGSFYLLNHIRPLLGSARRPNS